MHHTAVITITTLQRDISDEPSVMHCNGIFGERGGRFLVRYTTGSEEDRSSKDPGNSAADSRAGRVISTVTFDASSLEVTCTDENGRLLSRMLYEKGRETSCSYNAGAAMLDIVNRTADIQIEKTGSCGTDVVLSYDMDINGQHVSACELRMEIRYEQ